MINRYLRYAVLGFRILFPTRAEARYAKAIRASGMFDRDWYLSCNPRLPRLCKWLPERHYVLVGEAVGLCPSPKFSPRAYRHLNPDLPAGTAPFAHYIAEGQALGRLALDQPAGEDAPVLPSIDPDDRPALPATYAVVVHLYYFEMWGEIAQRLGAQRFTFDLFVSLADRPEEKAAAEAVRLRILEKFPTARIWTFPNHGRDILPFLHLAKSGLFAPYAAVCKLHSKKSPHRTDGDAWRNALIDGVLGDGGQTETRLLAFLDNPKAGIWVADGQRMQGALWWGPNLARAKALLARAGKREAVAVHDLVFAAGSIYWIKPAALAAMTSLPVSAADFEPEMGQVDGTTAHALERAFGVLVRRANLSLVQSSELISQHPPGSEGLNNTKDISQKGEGY